MNVKLCFKRQRGWVWGFGVLWISMQMVSQTQAQSVIFRDTFGTNSNNSALSTLSWKAVSGSSTTGTTDWTYTVDTSIGAWLATANGAPQNVDNVNTGAASLNQTQGILAFGLTSVNGRAMLVYTDIHSFNPADYSNIQFSWYTGNNSINLLQRVAIQVGGNWYASAQTFANTVAVSSGANFATGAELQTYNFNAAAGNWYSINYVVGDTLSLGSLVGGDLPTGDITAFGIFGSSTSLNGTNRIDTFTITATAIPETETAVLLIIGIAVLGVVALRRCESLCS